VVVGGLQMTLILGAAHLPFDVPVVGSLTLLIALTLLFIVANLCFGAATVVYYSWLPDLASPDERDQVSSRGWAIDDRFVARS